MGKKVNPRIFRMGLSERWSSRWFAGRDFANLLKQDILIRKFLKKELQEAGLDRVEIERSRGTITLNISAAKPGLVIGRGGSGIEELKAKIQKKFLDKDFKLQVNITEVSIPNLSANVVLQSIKDDIEKRIPFRRVMKQAVEKVMKAGAQGVKVLLSGRLNGVEIARREKLIKGKLPLQTLRSNIDYSRGVAATVYGAIGIKVWICKGEYFAKKIEKESKIKPSTKTVKLFSKEMMDIQTVDNKKAKVKKVEEK
jgi:small subunit ribosomal protein S3